MANPKYNSPALTKAFHDLLAVYQGTIHFQIAYDSFLGDSTDAGLEYEEQYMDLIAAKTPQINDQAAARLATGPPYGQVLATDPEGDQVGGSYYRAIYTEMKTAGVVFGLNARWMDEYVVEPLDAAEKKVKENLQELRNPAWDQTRDHKDNNKHPAAATFGGDSSTTDGILEIRYKKDDDTSRDDSNTKRKFKPADALYFISPPILKYIVYHAAQLSEQGKPPAENSYLKLAIELYKWLALDGYSKSGKGPELLSMSNRILGVVAMLETGLVRPGHLVGSDSADWAPLDAALPASWPAGSASSSRAIDLLSYNKTCPWLTKRGCDAAPPGQEGWRRRSTGHCERA
mgnify:CR=1 FL=1